MPYMTAIRRVATKSQLRRGSAPTAFGLSGPAGMVGAADEQTMDWALFAGVGLLATAAGIVGITYWKEHQMKSNPVKLVSSTDTKAAEKKIRSAAAARFGRGKADLWFEHGQWWARIDKGYYDQDYSVVDAYPGVAGTGIDFEELGGDY